MTSEKWKIGAKYKTYYNTEPFEYIGSSPSGKPIIRGSSGRESILNGDISHYEEVREPRRTKASVLEATRENIQEKDRLFITSGGYSDKYWTKIGEVEWVEKL